MLKNKEAETAIEAMNSTWNWRFGFPSNGFWADNGPEFQNSDMEELASKLNQKKNSQKILSWTPQGVYQVWSLYSTSLS